MQRATISELKNRLSSILARVTAGETVIVFDRDRPIARLEPLPADEFPESRLAALTRDGAVRPARSPMPMDLLEESPPESEGSALEALLRDRGEGR